MKASANAGRNPAYEDPRIRRMAAQLIMSIDKRLGQETEQRIVDLARNDAPAPAPRPKRRLRLRRFSRHAA